MEILVLGPMEVLVGGQPVVLGGRQRRTVLAILVVHVGEAVSTDKLIDELWGESPPAAARKTVQAHVAHLRRALDHDGNEHGVIAAAETGYVLTTDPEAIDSHRFERLVDEAGRLRATRPQESLHTLDQALDLFRGAPLAGLADSAFSLRVEASRLEELRLGAIEDRLEAAIASGQANTAASEARSLLAEHPLRERTWAMLMLALYRAGRQADALRAFSQARLTLAEEVGLEPSAELRALEQQILDQDPSLEAPSGLVTFLFTDIEGSTRLFDYLGERYVDVLDQHHRILRAVWAEHGGSEVSTEGDSFLVAFGAADDAITAAAAAQRALAAQDWPEGVTLMVRMGIHSGLAAPRGHSYVSLVVHQASRVVEAGFGGQVIVSQDTEFLATPALEVALRPLGRFRIRDFSEPVRLYQVVGEGLQEHFPAVRATPSDRHNIVEKPTATIGRETTIAALVERVAARRTVTLTGPGGVGKSRIAHDLGLAIAPDWDDGVWLVELAGVAEPDLVPGAVAEAIGAPAHLRGARTDDVLQHLETRKAVVILDNCEHLAGACRELVGRMQADCKNVAVIATSREPLRAPGEIRWPIEPLPVPGSSDLPAAVVDSPAGRLFQDRGVGVRPGFEIDGHNAAAVAEIVRHLDGLPLLIELAAAHLSFQSPHEILHGLEDSFRYLRSRDPYLSDRHRTMEGLLGWSYRLLEPREQAAFRRLSIFASGFFRETAAAAVANGDIDGDEVDELVWSLVDRSLVEADFKFDHTRYGQLETIRSYGRRHLDDASETEALATRLARWFLARIGPSLPPDRRWVGDVGVELDNLRALIPLVPGEHQDLAQQIACSIGRHHDATQSFHEGIDELTRLVGLLDKPSAARVSLLTTLGDLHLRTGQVDRAQELVEAAEELRAEQGSPEWDDVGVERTRGEITRRRGDLAGAVEIAREALNEPLSDRGRSRMYNLLGTTSAALGDLATAYDACQRELELNERLGYEGYVASAHGNLAEVALRLGDMPAAAGHQRSSLELAVALGSPAMVSFSLIVAARIAGWQEYWTTAVALHAKAEEQLEEIGLVLYEDDRRQSEDLLDLARAQMSEEAFGAARSRGLETTLENAIRLADDVLATAEGLQPIGRRDEEDEGTQKWT